MKDEIMCYRFSTGKVCGLGEGLVHIRMRVRDVHGIPTTLKLKTIPMTFRPNASRVCLASIGHSYNPYRGQNCNCGEAERAEVSG